MNSDADKGLNLDEAERLIRAAVTRDHPDLLVLPEFFLCLTGNAAGQRDSAEAVPEGPACLRLGALAKELNVAIHAGTLIERAGDAFYNTAVIFDRDGSVIDTYRKIHMFNAWMPDGTRISESEMVSPGESIVSYEFEGVKVGCATCYDLRFPELFQALRARDCDVVLLPAAFTLQTGKDHWEPLLRARAIDTQMYVFAAGQTGSHARGKKACWGHSMVVDPWGAVIAQASEGPGWVAGNVDLKYLRRVRQSLPVNEHHVLGANV
ncbi:carbon-nitrogen hydrolase family protein [Caballeronia sp. dw_19]|uniref:carbon-nitrogen hydrolase family protein n=1 Tax=Caballeronia sp. dw_19 TaxID=2719791 RepID=UPI001BD5F787|nr:carbon-nitrogen hydrolase family protein [Caballeronia sp. dw_19]